MWFSVIYSRNAPGLAYASGQLFFHFSRIALAIRPAPLRFRPGYHSRNGKAIMASETPSRKNFNGRARRALAIAIARRRMERTRRANEIEKPISLPSVYRVSRCDTGYPSRRISAAEFIRRKTKRYARCDELRPAPFSRENIRRKFKSPSFLNVYFDLEAFHFKWRYVSGFR